MEENFAENSFRTLRGDGRYIKGFKISKFEALVIGLKDSFSILEDNKSFYIEKIIKLEKQEWYKNSIEKNFLEKKNRYFFR